MSNYLPTMFQAAKGSSSRRTDTIQHKRSQPSHTKLKFRQRGQGGVADKHSGGEEDEQKDGRERLKTQLLRKEITAGGRKAEEKDDNDASLIKRRKVQQVNPEDQDSDDSSAGEEEEYQSRGGSRRTIQSVAKQDKSDSEPAESGSESEDDSDDGDDDDDDESEDEAETLQRELDKIAQERAERQRQEEEAEREREIAFGNPLLNKPQGEGAAGSVQVKRKWYDEGIFQNQAKGLAVRPEDEGAGRGFINDALRSDFHRKFISKYIR